MRYLLIAQNAVTHPYAIDVDAGTFGEAITAAAGTVPEKVSLTFSFVIDMESGRAMRVIRDESGELTVRDSAYKAIGIMTRPDRLGEIGGLGESGPAVMPAPEPEVSTMEIPE